MVQALIVTNYSMFVTCCNTRTHCCPIPGSCHSRHCARRMQKRTGCRAEPGEAACPGTNSQQILKALQLLCTSQILLMASTQPVRLKMLVFPIYNSDFCELPGLLIMRGCSCISRRLESWGAGTISIISVTEVVSQKHLQAKTGSRFKQFDRSAVLVLPSSTKWCKPPCCLPVICAAFCIWLCGSLPCVSSTRPTVHSSSIRSCR